jgi:monoterpene epsilon-lactone hydrolase
MSDSELAVIEDQLRGAPDFSKMPIDEMRRTIDAMADGTPSDPSIRYEQIKLGHVPVEVGLAPGSRVDHSLLYFHGGGPTGSVRSYRGLVGRIGQATGIRTIAVDFRLPPEHPFPTSSDDALAAYRALLEDGVDPATIVICGDSAGGGLAIVTLARLREEGLPNPRAAAVMGPWTDLSSSGQSMIEMRQKDVLLSAEVCNRMAALCLGGADARHPHASALFADLTGLPPLLIQVGSREVLLDDSIRLARRAAAAEVSVVLEIWPKMPHVWHQFSDSLGEARAAITRIGSYLKEQLAANTVTHN